MLDYEEAANFGHSKFAKLMRYYQYLERILQLEWFITKLQFQQDVVVHLDNAINLGLPFWKQTDYEKRRMAEVAPQAMSNEINPISTRFLHSKVLNLRTKKYIAEELGSMSSIFNNVIKRFIKTKEEDRYEFLNSYTEFRYF